MPIYEYECVQCGQMQEAIQKFSDPPLTTCNHCNGKLHRLISQSSFHLKGSGWYVTDYANKSKSTSAPSAESKETKSGKSTESATSHEKSSD